MCILLLFFFFPASNEKVYQMLHYSLHRISITELRTYACPTKVKPG